MTKTIETVTINFIKFLDLYNFISCVQLCVCHFWLLYADAKRIALIVRHLLLTVGHDFSLRTVNVGLLTETASSYILVHINTSEICDNQHICHNLSS